MKNLFFILQNRRSLLTTRLVYGLEGMKYIIQIYEGEINGHGEKERLPEEFQYEFEKEMLKHIHDLKKTNSGKRDGLREIYHQKFTNPHSSEVTNQMHSWVLSLNEPILLILLIFFCCILPVTLLKSISSAPYTKIFQSLSNWFDWFIFSNCRIKNIPVDLLRVNILKSV